MTARIRLPVDIELEDRLAFGLTARQLALLGATALLGYGMYAATAATLPLPLAAALTAPVVLVGLLLALGRRDGLSADQLVLCGLRFLARPRRHVLAPEGIPAPLAGTPKRPPLTPLDLPVRAVRRSGVVDLVDGSSCLLLRASSTSFALRSDEEQAALVEAFGRFLNSIAEPIEIAVRSEPVDLEATAAKLEQAAANLDEPALRRAAGGHARFLREMNATQNLRRREILLVLATRARDADAARTALERRAGEASELLRAADVELHTLRGEEAAAALARTLDPPGPPPGAALTGLVRAC